MGAGQEQAIARMDRALAEFRIRGPGVHTTRDLLRDILADPVFHLGTHTTSLLDGRSGQAGAALAG